MQMLEFNMVSRSDFEKFQSAVYRSFEKLDERFEKIDKKFARVDESMENLESRLNQKIGRVDENMENLESRLNQKIDHSISKLSLQLTVKLGVMLALSVGMISTILAIKL